MVQHSAKRSTRSGCRFRRCKQGLLKFTMASLLSSSLAPPQALGKAYCLKLSKLVVEVGRPVLQDVFDSIHPSTKLAVVLSSPKVQNKLLKLQQNNLLYQSQIDILYPSSGSVTAANFDISLLIVLLRNICSIASPKAAVWKNQPLPTDKSQAADIVRIRLCRNDLYHRTNLRITESDFEKKWEEIKDALIRLGGGAKYEEDIKNIKVGSVDPEMEKHYHDLLKSREEAEAQHSEDIHYIKTELEDLKNAFSKESESSVTIDIMAKFKLLAAGAVTLGWAAGCTYFLNRYKDDPEIVTGLVQRAIVPGTLAMGATVIGILRGSVIIKVKVTSLQALDYLWKSCNNGGEIEKNLQKVVVTDELIRQAPLGTDSVGISVKMSKDKYQTARKTLLGGYRDSIESNEKRDRKHYTLSDKRMQRDNPTKPSTISKGTDSVGISVKMSKDKYQTARKTLLGGYRDSIESNEKRDRKHYTLSDKRMRRDNPTKSSTTSKVLEASPAYANKIDDRRQERNQYATVSDSHSSVVRYTDRAPPMGKRLKQLFKSTEDGMGSSFQTPKRRRYRYLNTSPINGPCFNNSLKSESDSGIDMESPILTRANVRSCKLPPLSLENPRSKRLKEGDSGKGICCNKSLQKSKYDSVSRDMISAIRRSIDRRLTWDRNFEKGVQSFQDYYSINEDTNDLETIPEKPTDWNISSEFSSSVKLSSKSTTELELD